MERPSTQPEATALGSIVGDDVRRLRAIQANDIGGSNSHYEVLQPAAAIYTGSAMTFTSTTTVTGGKTKRSDAARRISSHIEDDVRLCRTRSLDSADRCQKSEDRPGACH